MYQRSKMLRSDDWFMWSIDWIEYLIDWTATWSRSMFLVVGFLVTGVVCVFLLFGWMR